MDESLITTSTNLVPIPEQTALHRGIEVRPGVKFDIRTESPADEPLAQSHAKGIFPPLCTPLVELVDRLVPQGGRVLDLGAHIGTFALAAAAMGRKVLAVEASPRNFALLNSSRVENGFKNLSLVHAAISDRPGVLSFYACGPYGHVANGSDQSGCVNVPAVTVETLLAKAGWDRVDFIKMDIEGSEIAGLTGMSKLLQRHDAPPIHIESNGHTLNFFGESPSTLKAALVAYGYKLFQVEDRRLIPIELDDFQGTTVVDYLAVKATPPLAKTWRYDRPMSYKEQVRRMRQSCLHGGEAERAYMARSLRSVPADYQADWRIAKAVEVMKQDTCTEVREAVGDLTFVPAQQPWYAFWRK